MSIAHGCSLHSDSHSANLLCTWYTAPRVDIHDTNSYIRETAEQEYICESDNTTCLCGALRLVHNALMRARIALQIAAAVICKLCRNTACATTEMDTHLSKALKAVHDALVRAKPRGRIYKVCHYTKCAATKMGSHLSTALEAIHDALVRAKPHRLTYKVCHYTECAATKVASHLRKALKAIHDALVRTHDELQVVDPAEVLHAVGPKCHEARPPRRRPHALHANAQRINDVQLSCCTRPVTYCCRALLFECRDRARLRQRQHAVTTTRDQWLAVCPHSWHQL